jgi:DNA-binding winged helix-turn-helix (wHTH) protein
MSTQPVPMSSPQGRQDTNDSPFAHAYYVCFGAFQLNLRKEELFKDGARVKLQGKVYQVLLALLKKPGEIVTREELRAQLWPPDTHVNYDANVNTTVNKLRQLLGDSRHRPAFVETIPRKGYSFVAKVEYLDRPVAPKFPQAAKPSPIAPVSVERSAEVSSSFFRPALLSNWFTVGVVALVAASVMLGAALVLYAHH